MPFHLCGWTESQDSATLVNVAALADDLIRVNGDNITVPGQSQERPALNRILGAYGLGPNITQLRLVAPSLEQMGRLNVAPVDLSAEPTYPLPLAWFGGNAVQLDSEENLRAEASEDAAGASRVTALIWLCDQPPEPVAGRIITVRATGTTTLVANAWTRGTITLEDELPAGRYALVGAAVNAAGLQAFRFRPIGSPVAPGGIGRDTLGDAGHDLFRMGRLGVWFTFSHNNLPQVEYLSNSADTAETLFLDLVKVE